MFHCSCSIATLGQNTTLCNYVSPAQYVEKGKEDTLVINYDLYEGMNYQVIFVVLVQ